MGETEEEKRQHENTKGAARGEEYRSALGKIQVDGRVVLCVFEDP